MARTRRRSSSEGTSGIHIAESIAKHSRLIVAAVLLLTLALSYPMLYWSPEETAAQSPVSEVTLAQELVAERFAGDVFDYAILVEAVDGDLLDKAPLLALLDSTAGMRSNPTIAPLLATRRDPNLGFDILGMWTIADSVDQLLRRVGVAGGLAEATEDQVDGVVAAILEESEPADWGLSIETIQDDHGVWQSPALFALVAADNAGLGGGGFVMTLGSGYLEKEHFARDLVAALESDGSELQVWAIAADVNLTSDEQGELAGPYIGLTIAAVLLIVGIAFRSFWAVAVAGAGLAVLMVWMQGGANLLGFKRDQILSTILPISIISFGIDSAFHGIGRVREQQRRGDDSHRAFVVGMGSVLAALVLAAVSDAAAFLSNTAAGIESIVQFGLAAAIATVSAFVLLGVVTPLLLAHIEGVTGGRPTSRWGRLIELLLSVGAAGAATATVLVLVFVSAELGLALLAGYVVAMLVLPYTIARGRPVPSIQAAEKRSGSRRLGASVAAVASRPVLTVGVAALVTTAALWAASHLEVTFDVNDFFSPDSDFVVGLDKTAEHLGGRAGEPATVFVESDLTSPDAIAALERFTDRVAETGVGPLAADANGRVRVDAGVLDLLADASGSVSLDSAVDLGRFYAEAVTEGFGEPSGEVWWSADEIGTVLWLAEDGTSSATVLTYQIPESGDLANVVEARRVLEPLAADLEQELRPIDPESQVVVTGSAVYRDDQLAAIRRAMLLALPIAIVACFVVAALFMRSIRYAVVSVIPILLVVAWLYGFMYVAGFSVNVVTSIIGAVSVGIGIDFSTHFTMRFLEEKREGVDRSTALAEAGAGTGTALFGSAVTSVAGFGALAFAPMPMFASYGLLTAIMIALALVASLFVLPSLLVIVTADRTARSRTHRTGTPSPPIAIGISSDVRPDAVDRLRTAMTRRRGDMTVTHETGLIADMDRMVAAGELDLAVVQRWPGAETTVPRVTLDRDEIVVVGMEDPVSMDQLGHTLLVTAQDPGMRNGVRSVFRAELGHAVLTRAVADLATGLRLAERTGGAMILPRSVAGNIEGVSIASLEPTAWLDLEVLVAPGRSGDPAVGDLIAAWVEVFTEDDSISSSRRGA